MIVGVSVLSKMISNTFRLLELAGSIALMAVEHVCLYPLYAPSEVLIMGKRQETRKQGETWDVVALRILTICPH